jgi:phospholipid/cholesterol/gamma-HCH transport system substrate-binding protein
METKANFVAVGVFVVAGMTALVFVLLWLAGAQYREEYVYYRTSFNGPVTGLGKGTVVRYNGIDVGRIDSLAFDTEDPKRVIATLQVDNGLQLHEDSVASIESQGLTGGSYVEIEGGTRNSPNLKTLPGQQYPMIRSKPSTLQEIYQSGPELLARLNQVADNANALLDEQNRKTLSEILVNLRDVTATLASRSGDIDELTGNLASASAKLNQTLASADDAARKVGEAGTDADQMIRGSKTQLTESTAQLAQLLAETRTMVDGLSKLSQDLEREPTRLLFGDRREGYTPK